LSFGIRAKLFFAFFFFIVVGFSVTGLFLSRYLKENIIQRTEDELKSFAESARLFIERTGSPADEVEGDSIADALGKAFFARVTIIKMNGTVIGDSSLTLPEVRSVENHFSRPEIVEARRSGFGSSVRYSKTVKKNMMYVAVLCHGSQGSLVIRTSKSLDSVSTVVSVTNRILLWASIVGLLVAAVMSVIASHLFFRRLKSLVASAKSLVNGESGNRIDDANQDELGGLAGSLNELSDKLREYVTQLAERRDQFEAVLEGMSEAVVALDENGQVTLMNRAGAVLLGITDQPVSKVLLKTERLTALHELASSDETGQGIAREFDLKGDVPRRILARATRLSKGGVVIVLLDVTELRKLERLRRDFVSNVSHELRTPISIIQANAETLRDGAMEDTEAAIRFLDAMITSTKRLSSLIADLLDISRIEEGKLELHPEPIPVFTALKRAASSLETKASDRHCAIDTEPCPDVLVAADARALDQVLFNLVDNAVKYGGQGVKVTLRASADADVIRIEVEDDGPGIESEYRERLFERFFRVDKGRSREMGGTGLGLAIVKHLVLAMQGEVEMVPAIPHGSVFRVSLPRANT
jgi:two-component system phosphate regulon sensor histidine kinase PhoR